MYNLLLIFNFGEKILVVFSLESLKARKILIIFSILSSKLTVLFFKTFIKSFSHNKKIFLYFVFFCKSLNLANKLIFFQIKQCRNKRTKHLGHMLSCLDLFEIFLAYNVPFINSVRHKMPGTAHCLSLFKIPKVLGYKPAYLGSGES